MNDINLTDDEVSRLRSELGALGLRPGPQPEDFGLHFRPAETFAAQLAKRRKTRPRRFGAVVSVGVAAAMAALILMSPGGQNEPVAPDIVTASQVLNSASNGALEQRPADPRTPFWHVRSIVQQGADEPRQKDVWHGHFSQGALIDGGSRAPLGIATFPLQRRNLSWEGVLELPSDHAGLTDVLRQETGNDADSDWLMFKMAGELLASSPAPPKVRAALWQVLASIPNVALSGRAQDLEGRYGRSVTLTNTSRGSLTYIVDVERGEMLQMSLEPMDGSGRDVYRETFLAQGPAASIS